MPSVHVPDPEPAADPEPAPIAPKPVPTSSRVPASTELVALNRGAPELRDEASFALGASRPRGSRSAGVAAAGETGRRELPDSPNAPEFQWNVVKALFNMAHLDEAKNEARVMLWKYPSSSFTGDVIHHLLNPPPNPREP